MARGSSEFSEMSDSNNAIFSHRFPPVMEGKINITQYLKASSELVRVVERLGKVFAPVKYDMQGNIDKIRKNYKFAENSCLLDLIKEDISKQSYTTAEGVLWLNRAILFFELIFQEIISCLRNNNYNVRMKRIFTVGYEGSVKKYHGWVTHQLFSLICNMSPTLPEVLKSLEVDHNINNFENSLLIYNKALQAVRCRIDEFFLENRLFMDPQ